MSPVKRKGDARKADDLFRLIIHARGSCERCGDSQGPFEAAHIHERRFSAVRCCETNAWLLCRPCHRLVDGPGREKLLLVERTIGIDRYDENLARINEFTRTRPTSTVFWREEVARLTARCDELGIDTKRRAA